MAYGSSNAADYMRSKRADGKAGCTLADLGAQPVGREAAQELVESRADPCAAGKAELRRRYEQQFPDWLCSLQEGYSLCLHGFGSKSGVLQAFVDAQLRLYDEDCLTVYGMRPGVTARSLLVNAAAFPAIDNPPAKLKSRTDRDLLQMIAERESQLYIVLHNIEGFGLRSLPGQAVLSRLAACPTVSLLASYDHVNTPILWDEQTKHCFKWLHHHVPTFEPHWRELEDGRVPPLLAAHRSSRSSVGAAVTVLRSFTPKARDVFRTIVELQQNEDGGVEISELWQMCHSRFIANSMATLKNNLQEFRDHDLVDDKHAENGADLLYVPMSEEMIAAVLKGIEDE